MEQKPTQKGTPPLTLVGITWGPGWLRLFFYCVPLMLSALPKLTSVSSPVHFRREPQVGISASSQKSHHLGFYNKLTSPKNHSKTVDYLSNLSSFPIQRGLLFYKQLRVWVQINSFRALPLKMPENKYKMVGSEEKGASSGGLRSDSKILYRHLKLNLWLLSWNRNYRANKIRYGT